MGLFMNLMRKEFFSPDGRSIHGALETVIDTKAIAKSQLNLQYRYEIKRRKSN